MNQNKPVRTIKNTKEYGHSSHTKDEAYSGRIVANYGQQLEVEILDGPLEGSIQRCHRRASVNSLVTGDLVRWKPDSADMGVVLSRCARNNVFGRYNAEGKFKPLASNLDCVMVVFAATPKPFLNLIDRYLVAIHNLELEAFLILYKVRSWQIFTNKPFGSP